MWNFGRGHDILNFEIAKADRNAVFLKQSHVFATSESRLNLGFGTGAHHVARGKGQGRGTRVTYSDRRGCKLLGVVLYKRLVKRDGAQVQVVDAKVEGGDDVLEFKGGQGDALCVAEVE